MVYAGFKKRFVAGLVDFLVTLPACFSILLILHCNKFFSIFFIILSVFIVSMYPIICISIWGQTIGKHVVGIKVIKLDGTRCFWREGILRIIVVVFIQLVAIYLILMILYNAPDTFYIANYSAKLTAIHSATIPILQKSNLILTAWFLTDTIIFLSNNKRRALHDFIAGTICIHNEN